jgi:hypothetical protein
MKFFVRPLLCAVGFVALLAAVGSTFASWLSTPSEWNPSDLARRITEEGRKSDELNRTSQILIRCNKGKTRVTQELIAGRLTLGEAIHHFHELELTRDRERGKNPSEQVSVEAEKVLSRCVIKWVRSSYDRTSPQCVQRVRELEQEYQRQFHKTADPHL